MKELTVMEQIILSSILNLKDGAYGFSVRHRVKKVMGKNINYGTLDNALEQLLKKDYVRKTKGDSTPDRIGRPRIYYNLTPAGEKDLGEAFELRTTILDLGSSFLCDCPELKTLSIFRRNHVY
jgi:DNA-binding PadR family transcriptional regulator